MDIFLDTSIQIARLLRPTLKTPIQATLSNYQRKTSGTVALQEFKRRVLKEAAYLLTKLNQTGSYKATLEYVTSVLPQQQNRKRTICLLLLHGILHNRSDDELTERARLYLRTLLIHGEKQFINLLDQVVPDSNCHLAKLPIRELKRYQSYEIETRCSKTMGKCQIGQFLTERQELCNRLLNFLKGLPAERLTSELERARDFLGKVLTQGFSRNIHSEESCLRHGDLILALESHGCDVFYTMNYRESQAFADCLGQDLIVRPNNPDSDEKTFRQSEKPWPPLTPA